MKKQGAVFSKLIIPIIIAAIVIYLIISAWVGLRNSYPTTIAYTDVMTDSVNASGWVVRQEEPIPSGGSGLVQLQRNPGEKIAKNGVIAVVYQNEEYVEHQEALLKTRNDLSALQYATYEGSPSGAALEEQMLASMINLRTASSSENYSNLSEQTENYRKLILRREFLVSSQAVEEMSAAATELNAKYNSLQSYQSGATTISAAASGLFSSDLDGYETLLSPEKLSSLSPDGLRAFSELKPLDGGDSMGKLITNPVWYYAVTVPRDYSAKLSVGKRVDVYFDAISKTLEMEVESIGEVQEDEAVVVLSSARNEKEAEELRQESSRLIFRSEEGILIPKEALRVYEEENGVFIVSGYTARFRPVEIIAENEDFYLVSPNLTDETDTRLLRPGDEVILASAELYDGKVVR